MVTPARAATGINQTLNFQGRLLNAAGAVVPDGTYNIQFKIYQDGNGVLGGGDETLKWTESWVYGTGSPDNRVVVRNGYFSVRLGSITAFGSSVDWNQDTLWLSMNVGNTSTAASFAGASGDGEMSPFRRLGSSVYALNAGQLGGLSAAQFVQLGTGTVQADSSTNASVFLNKTGATGDLMTLQKNAALAFSVDNDGDLLFGSNANKTISVAQSAAGAVGRSLTLTAGQGGTGTGFAGGDLVLQGGVAGGTNGNGGSVTVDAGTKTGTGTNGTVSIGMTNASGITIGRTGVTTTVNGQLTVAANQNIVMNDGTGRFQLGNDGFISVYESGNSDILTIDTRVGFSVLNDGDTTTGPVFHVDGQNGRTTVKAKQDANGGLYVTQLNNDPVLRVITAGTEGSVQVGYTGDSAATPFILDNDATGDPTGVKGAMYYNNSTNKFRCYQNTAWTDCIAADTLQSAYNNSTSPEITLGSAATAGLTIRDNAAPISGNLLEVRDNGLTTTYLGITTSALTLGTNVDLLMQGATAYISNPQGQTDSEAFGLNAAVSNTGSLAVGSSASAGINAVSIGYSTDAQGNAVAIGNNAFANSSGLAIGRDASASTNSIAIGREAVTTASNQLVIGSENSTQFINHVVIGDGVTSATPNGFTLQGTSGSGSNIAGASVNIAGGQGTGSAAGGAINLQVSAAGTAGSSLNSLATTASFSSTAITIGNASAAQTVTVGSTNTTSATAIQGGSGGISLQSTKAAGATGNGNTITANVSPTSGSVNGNWINTALAPASNSSANVYGSFNTLTTSNAVNFTGDLMANLGQLNWSGTGTSTTGRLAGALGKVVASSGSGAIQNAVGVQAEGQFQGGAVTNYYGLYSTMNSNNSVAVQNAYGLKIDNFAAIGSAAPTNFYAIAADGGMTRLTGSSAYQFQVQNAALTPVMNVDTTTTNLIANPSFELDTANWSATGGATIAKSAATQSYDGNFSLQLNTTAAAADGAKVSYNLAGSTQYTLSFFAKLSSGSFSTLEVGRSDNGSTETACTLSPTFGIGPGGVGNPYWKRFTCTFMTGAVSGSRYLYFKQTDATSRTFYIDAVQLEAASSATIYRSAKTAFGGTLVVNGGQPEAGSSDFALRVNSIAGGSGIQIRGSGDANVISSLLDVVSADGLTAYFNVNEASRATAVKGGSSFFNSAALTVTTVDSGAPAVDVKAASGQTADILRVYDGAGTPNKVFSVDSSGNTMVANKLGVGVSGSIAAGIKMQVDLATNEIVRLNDNASASGIWGQNIGLLSQSAQAQIVAAGSVPLVFMTNGTRNSMAGSQVEQMRISSGKVQLATGTILQGTSGTGTNIAGSDLTLAGGQGTGTGVGGNVNVQIAAPGVTGASANSLATVFSISGTNGSVLFKNAGDSATALQIQKADTSVLLTADTSNMVVKVGTTGSASLSGAKLLVTAQEVTTTLRVGDATNGVEFSATGAPTYRGSARPTRKITLSPEYAGASMTADGANNTGTMTTDNMTTTPFRNYYKWTTTQGTAQDYDIWVKVPVPSDFSALPAGQTLCLDVYASATTANTIALSLYGTDNAAVTLTDGDLTPTATGTWQNQCTSSITGGTYAADGTMTLDIKLTAPSNGEVRIGDITINYLSKW